MTRWLLAPAALLLATGCATTIDSSLASTTVPTTVPASTTLPSGPAATLLPALLDEAAQLSAKVRDNAGDRESLERIQALWDASKQEIGRTHPELLGTFQGQLDLLGRAVQFNRPADADKAFRNLQTLVDAALA